MKARIFDHLDGEPEDRTFSRVAHAMHRSAWWWRIPEYVQPAPVSGEVRRVGARTGARR